MTWPPDPLPNNRDNSTPQIDNHPTDHNDIANTLAEDFVGQINDNIDGISGNAGGIASNLASINAALVNFIPGVSPIVRGDVNRIQQPNGDPIGDGFLRCVEPAFLQMTGGTIGLTTNFQTLPNTTSALPNVNSPSGITQHIITATFDFSIVGGTVSGYAQGVIALEGVPHGGSAILAVGTIASVSRATVTVLALAGIPQNTLPTTTVSLQARIAETDGSVLANVHPISSAWSAISYHT